LGTDAYVAYLNFTCSAHLEFGIINYDMR